MRAATRWTAAISLYAAILFVTAVLAFGLAWGCHHVPPGSDEFLCSEFFSRYGFWMMVGVLCLGHTLAVSIGVALAPTHKRTVAWIGVLAPVVAVIGSLRNGITGKIDLFEDVLPVLMIAMPGALCAALMVRSAERRRVLASAA